MVRLDMHAGMFVNDAAVKLLEDEKI